MDRLPHRPGRRPHGREPAASFTVPGLVSTRVLDADLAALLWLMLDGNVPLVVAESPAVIRAFRSPDAAPEPIDDEREASDAARAVLDAFLDLLPPAVTRLDLDGADETFSWLGDVAALGGAALGHDLEPVASPGGGRVGSAGDGVTMPSLALPPQRLAPPETTFLVAGEIGPDDHADMSGPRARLLLRALARGYGLGATVRADSLERVLVALGAPPTSASADELRRLGIVLVLDVPAHARADRVPPVERRQCAGPAPAGEPDGSWRVVACHFVRPLDRDVAGHVQRRPPAVLAAWDDAHERLEHFEWGVTAELAMRVGLSRDEFEREQIGRSRTLASLAASGPVAPDALHALLARRSRSTTGGDA